MTVMKIMLVLAMGSNLRRPLVPLGHKLQKDYVYDTDFPIDGNSKFEIIEKEKLQLEIKLDALKTKETDQESALEQVKAAEERLEEIEAKIHEEEESRKEAEKSNSYWDAVKMRFEGVGGQQDHSLGQRQGEAMKAREEVERFREEERAAMQETSRLRQARVVHESIEDREAVVGLGKEISHIDVELQKLAKATKALAKKRQTLQQERKHLMSAAGDETKVLDETEARLEGLTEQREDAERHLAQLEHGDRDATVLKDVSEGGVYDARAHEEAKKAAEASKRHVHKLKKLHRSAKHELEEAEAGVKAAHAVATLYKTAVGESEDKLEKLQMEVPETTEAPALAWNDPESWK